MPSSNLLKSFAVATLIGVGIAALTAVVGHAFGVAVSVSVLSGMTAATIAGAVAKLRRRS